MRRLKIRRLIFGVSIVVLVVSVAFTFLGDQKSALFPIASLISILFTLIEPTIFVWDRFIPDAETRYRQPVLANQRSDRAYLDGRIKEFEDEHRLEKLFVSPQASTVERMVDTTFSSDGRPLENIEQAVTLHDRRFVLVGEPGAGKSTTLRYLMKQAIIAYQRDQAANRLPVWINLGLSGTPIDADKLLEDWWARTSLESTPGERIDNRNLWLFMDGLNEMPLDSREARAKSLREFLERYPHLPVIVTCRIRDYADDAAINLGLPAVTVHELDDARIQEFLHKRGAKAGLWEKICENEALRRWAANPLKLEMMIAVYDPDRALPESLDQLYGYYVERAYHRFKDERQKQANVPLLKLEWPVLESSLKLLAFRMIADGKGTAAEIGWVRKEIGRTTLRDGLNLGVLIRDGNAIKFYHQSLHSFFSIERLGEILTANTQSLTQRNRKLVLIRQIADLGEAGVVAIEPLLSALRDADKYVRRSAADALGEIGDLRAVDPLIEALQDKAEFEPFPMERYASFSVGFARNFWAPYSLRTISDRRSINFLNEVLGKRSSVRQAAAIALGKIGDPRAVESLITALADPIFVVRGNAARALGELSDPRAIDPLITALADPKFFVRGSAARALGRTGDLRAVDPLIIALADPSPDVRSNAAYALGQLSDPRAIDPLNTALADQIAYVRINAACALWKLGDPRAIDPLITALADPEYGVGTFTANALREIGTPEAMQAVEKWEQEEKRRRAE